MKKKAKQSPVVITDGVYNSIRFALDRIAIEAKYIQRTMDLCYKRPNPSMRKVKK